MLVVLVFVGLVVSGFLKGVCFGLEVFDGLCCVE